MLRVLDSDDGRDLGEAIPDTRACSVAWEPDGSGFAYTRYPEGDEYHRTVHHHRLGDRWHDDPVVWAEHPNPQAWPDVTMSPDGALAARPRAASAGPAIDVHLLDRSTGTWRRWSRASRPRRSSRFAGDGTSLVGVTTVDAPRGRVVRVPLGRPPGRLGDARRRGRRRAVPPGRVAATVCSSSPPPAPSTPSGATTPTGVRSARSTASATWSPSPA